MFMPTEICKKRNRCSHGYRGQWILWEFSGSVDISKQPIATVSFNVIPMLLASGERVLLQIATVAVQSVDGSVTVTGWVLLDSASQRTSKTDHLSRKLKLTSE